MHFSFSRPAAGRADGRWRLDCDQEIGSTRGSFHTTINVLEGLLEFKRATGGSPAVKEAHERGQEYLLHAISSSGYRPVNP